MFYFGGDFVRGGIRSGNSVRGFYPEDFVLPSYLQRCQCDAVPKVLPLRVRSMWAPSTVRRVNDANRMNRRRIISTLKHFWNVRNTVDEMEPLSRRCNAGRETYSDSNCVTQLLGHPTDSYRRNTFLTCSQFSILPPFLMSARGDVTSTTFTRATSPRASRVPLSFAATSRDRRRHKCTPGNIVAFSVTSSTLWRHRAS